MDDSYRPVKLQKVVIGYQCHESTSNFRFDLSLNYKLSSLIKTYSENKPTLVVSEKLKRLACKRLKSENRKPRVYIGNLAAIFSAMHFLFSIDSNERNIYERSEGMFPC